jgi:lipid-binding SYLF domain-containing protein
VQFQPGFQESLMPLRKIAVVTLLCLVSGAAVAGWNPDDPKAQTAGKAAPSGKIATLDQACRDTLTIFTEADPSLKRFVEKAYAYAVFPKITKGGIGLGGSGGNGLMYESGKVVGTSRASQFTIGAQLGGMSFRQVVFFKDRSSAEEFKAGTFRFGAAAAAVAASAGGASNTDYSDGVATFTMARNGAMLEASIGGQKFSYKPL